MGITGFILLFVVLLVFVFGGLGVTLHSKSGDAHKKASVWGISALLLQVLLLVLFFTGVLGEINEMLYHVLWWGIVLCGFVFGIKEFKFNILLSFATIFLSILLTILKLLLQLIASM